MAYTLISAVGTGMYKEGYRKTKYVFPDNREVETHIFLNALLEVNYRDFSTVILVGTVTSAWDMLVDDKQDEDFWLTVNSARETGKIDQSLIHELEVYLERKIGKTVVIKVHTDTICEATSLDIFNVYSSIIPQIQTEKILFDITHGFRSMPILLYQALQFSVSQNSNIKAVELVYGEYVEGKKCSYVRDLSSYWRYSQISDALTIFKDKLDGQKLANLVEEDWLEGAKAIRRLSEVVQANFALQIIEILRNITNVLDKKPEELPSYWQEILNFLEELLLKLDKNNKSQSKILFNYSKLLASKKLDTQSIIALQVAVETAIAEFQGSDKYIGDYEWWQETGRGELNSLKGKDKKMKNSLNNLEHLRNQIAHGGSKGKLKGFPQAANIPNIFQSGVNGVEILFSMLEQEKNI